MERYSAHFLAPLKCENYLYDTVRIVGELTIRPQSQGYFWCEHELYSPTEDWMDVELRSDDLVRMHSTYLYQTERIRSGMHPVYDGYIYDGERKLQFANFDDALRLDPK